MIIVLRYPLGWLAFREGEILTLEEGRRRLRQTQHEALQAYLSLTGAV